MASNEEEKIAEAPLAIDVNNENEQGSEERLSVIRTILVLVALYGISAATSLGTGLVMIGIPQVANQLSLRDSLLLWPGAAYSLVSGCCFLLSGKLADLIGSRVIGLCGCLVMVVSLALTGVSQTGIQFIAFRSLQGLGAAMFLPTNISIWTSAAPKGRLRNFGFACLSFSSPVGLQTGYLLAGAFGEPGRSWRWGFWICSGIVALLLVLGFIAFPVEKRPVSFSGKSLWRDLDLVGMFISILVLGFLGFALAELSDSVETVRSPQVISSLVITVVSGAAFVYWMKIREQKGLSPLVPNSIWKNPRFSLICVILTICWATSNSIEWFFSLYFQEVQAKSGLQTAVWFIPNVLVGLITGIFVGFFVDRLPVNIVVTLACLMSAAAPLIMALVSPTTLYWKAEFWALILAPTAQDVLYTVANIIIAETMPGSQHGLAGGIFNALGGVGTSIGLAILAIVSNSTISKHSGEIKVMSELLLTGYRAAFWTSFGMSMAVVLLGAIALRSAWNIGKA